MFDEISYEREQARIEQAARDNETTPGGWEDLYLFGQGENIKTTGLLNEDSPGYHLETETDIYWQHCYATQPKRDLKKNKREKEWLKMHEKLNRRAEQIRKRRAKIIQMSEEILSLSTDAVGIKYKIESHVRAGL